MHTTDIGRAFFHLINTRPGTPLLHRAPTFQIEPPFQRSPRSLVIRLFPLNKAIVIGWWSDTTLEEDESLLEAVSGWGISLDPELDLEDDDVRATIRENVGRHGLEINDEWEIISMLGVSD